MNEITGYLKNITGTVFAFIRKHYMVIIPAGLILLIFTGYILGYSRNSEDYFFSSFQKSIEDKNAEKLSSFINSDGKAVLGEDSRPLLEYLSKENNKEIFINEIKKNGNYNGFTLKKMAGLFADKYYLECSGVQIKINTNYPSRIIINNREVGMTKAQEGLTIEGRLPGLYSIKAVADTEYGDIENIETIPLFNDQEINIELQGNPVTIINTPYQEGRVYINNKDINRKVSDINNYGFFPKDDSNRLYFVYDFPWGEISSEEVAVGSLPEVSPKIQMVNEKLQTDISEKVEEFYASVFSALNKEDMNEIKNVPENIKFSIYSDLTKKYFILKNVYEIKNISCKTENDSFKFDGNSYTGKVRVDIQYSTAKRILGVPVALEGQKASFLTDCLYKESEWEITWINKM